MYRQVSVAWFFQFLQMNHEHVAGHVATEGMYLPQAMETLVKMAFEKFPDFDYLVVYEHDMIPPVDAFDRVAQYGPEHDIVGSVYFKHDWPYHVMAWCQVQPPLFSPLTREMTQQLVENPALYEVDGVAMGFTAISRRVLEQWNPEVSMWFPTPPLVGHDLHFCNEAKKAQHGPNRDEAFKVWLDTGIGCGHLTLVPIGYSDSQEALALANPPQWTEGGTPCYQA